MLVLCNVRVLNHHGEGNLIMVFAIGVRCAEVDFSGTYFAVR